MKRNMIRSIEEFAAFMVSAALMVLATWMTLTIHPAFAVLAVAGFLGTVIAGNMPN